MNAVLVRRSQIVAGLGGALVVVAAFLVWVSVEVGASAVLQSDGFASASGLDQTEGKITLLAGLAIVGAAAGLGREGRVGRWAPLLGVAPAIAAALVMFVALVDLQQKSASALQVGSSVSIGIGIWLTGVGAVVALVGFGRSLGGSPSSARP